MKEYFREEITEPKILHNKKIGYEPHFHNEVEIIVMYEGRARAFVNESEYVLSSGECLIVFPNVIHSYRTDERVDVGKFIFCVDKESKSATVLNEKIPINPIVSKEAVDANGIRALSEETAAKYSVSSELLRDAYLKLLTAKILENIVLTDRKNIVEGSSVMSVLHYCELHFKENLTLNILSEELHISVSHLSHIFCNRLKINFRQYINYMRINEAKIMLRQTDCTVTEISENVGFGSLRSFDKVFRSIIGESPREYREHKISGSEEKESRRA